MKYILETLKELKNDQMKAPEVKKVVNDAVEDKIDRGLQKLQNIWTIEWIKPAKRWKTRWMPR